MKQRLSSVLLALALLCTCLPRLTLPVSARTGFTCVLADEIEIGKTYVIVAEDSYALTNRQEGPALRTYADGAETTLASAPVTVSEGVITSEVTGDMLWTVAASTAPEAYDGVTQYFLQDVAGSYLRRSSGSSGNGARLLTERELYTKLRFNTWSFYPREDGSLAMYANSERAYGSDCPYYLFGNETSFDSPSKVQRSPGDPFAFTRYDDCSGIRLYEAVGYAPCDHVYEDEVVPPTCTEAGYTLHVCVKCGDSYADDEVDALLHDWPKEGAVTLAPTETERGVLTFTCTRCGAQKDRPLAAGNEKAHKGEILFISDIHSGRKAEEGYHNLRAMFRLLRANDDFIPEVVSDGGDHLESRTYDDADWPHCFEVLHDILYQGSPDTVHALGVGNHDWEWSRQSEEMIEKLLGVPRVGCCYSGDDFEIFHIGAHMNGTGQEIFLEQDVEALRDFLASMAGSGRLIFIQTHWPLHYGYNSSQWRTTANADLMIDLLNEYAETLDICFIWGHNHNEDEMRHRCLYPGDELQYAKEASKQIRFTYVNAGCLNERHAKEGAGPSDSYYGPGYLLEARVTEDALILDYGHITGAWPDPDEAQYDHDADLLYVPNIQEARASHHEIPRLHRAGCDHVYEDEVVPPTCTEAGYTLHTCTRCGSVLRDGETAPLGHDPVHHDAKAPDCTEAGWEAYETCSRCDYTTYAELPALGHAPEAVAAVAPDCTHTGLTEGRRCGRCGETLTPQTELPALGHAPEAVAAVAPDCTHTGLTEGRRCGRCGEILTPQTDLPALGHDWGDRTFVTAGTVRTGTRVCGRCGETETLVVDLTALIEAIREAEAAETDACTEQTAAALAAALSDAQAALETAQSQAAADAAAEELRAAVTALEKRPLDTSALEKAIEEGKAADTGGCTEASVKALEDAVAAGERALGEAAAQKELDDAARAIEDAVKGLEPVVPPFRFADVTDESEYFFEPVYWAYNHDPQITTGTDDTRFSPGEGCTRAQVVTFLWRAEGRPPAGDAANPFRDVPTGEYYYDAVLWAVENGITTGTEVDQFSPDETCTRAQIVTFLWRAAGKPPAEGAEAPFKDVPSGAYYAAAVLWAVDRGVTTGTEPDRFSPEDTCTRAQIVTFLFRAAAGGRAKGETPSCAETEHPVGSSEFYVAE